MKIYQNANEGHKTSNNDPLDCQVFQFERDSSVERGTGASSGS